MTVNEQDRVRHSPFLMFTWFGLLTGWLELGLVLSRRTLDPHVSRDMVRANRHYVWMVPLSDVLIFVAVGLAMVPLAWFFPRLTRWLSLRLPIALVGLALLSHIEGLYAVAAAVLSCGLAAEAGRRLGPRVDGFGRIVRVSFPALAAGLVVLAGLNYGHVASAERRALSVRPAAKPGVPNVLLIVLDNVRAASLSLHGHDRPTAPNLERWARRGMIYAEARATAPWTLPTHASLLTGRWPHELSVGWERALDATYPTLAEVLEREGYATAGFVGNTYFCNAAYGLDRGFARYEDVYENQTVSLFETLRSSGLGRRLLGGLGYADWDDHGLTAVRKTAEMINRDVLGWLAAQRPDQPYFAFINYFDAHAPFQPPEGGPDPLFGMAARPLDERAAIEWRFEEWSEAGRLTPTVGTPDQIESEALALYRDTYESCIAYLDRQVGQLLDEMQLRGLLENTLVIVTSDHGEHFGDHGLVGHCLSLYRAEVHVPLLIIPPTSLFISSAPPIVHEPVSLREVPATVAQWVGLGAQSPFPGRSLTRFLGGDPGQAAEPSPVLCEVQQMTHIPRAPQIPSSCGPLRSLSTRERVYIRSDSGREELYDHLNDPFESVNLATRPESRPVLDRFREELRRLCCLHTTTSTR